MADIPPSQSSVRAGDNLCAICTGEAVLLDSIDKLAYPTNGGRGLGLHAKELYVHA